MLGEIDGVDGKLPNRSPCIAGKTFNKVTFNQKKLMLRGKDHVKSKTVCVSKMLLIKIFWQTLFSMCYNEIIPLEHFLNMSLVYR